MTDLWTEASWDHERMAHEAAVDRARAELEGIMPFLLASRSDEEFAHRHALADNAFERIAASSGVQVFDIRKMAADQYLLLRQALMEGQDPLDATLQSVHNYGTGPEVPDSHDLGVDYSHGYSEVPQGAPGGPAPQVVTPRFNAPEPMIDAQASRRTAGWIRRADYDATTPPDTGTGGGSVDIGVGSQDANGGQGGPPSMPSGMEGQADRNVPTQPLGQVTSSRDPVRMQVLAVAQSVQATNPWLPREECLRVARKTVGRFFRTAGTDWAPNVMSDAPPQQTDDGGGGGGNGGGGLGSAVEHGLEWKGLRSMLPGGGGGGAGAAGGLAEVAEAAAL